MARNASTMDRARLSGRDVAKFTALVALLAIFSDAAVGHGLMWENDPYWTYWVTKTFLIATIFGLGTAWFGIGAGRGAAITLVHTIVLTVYYWSLAPIGLPSSPVWLDLEHTWITGVPIHFAVIYLGYLTALWLWRRRAAADVEERTDRAPFGTSALAVGVVITIVAGGISSLALGDFPGLTWFLTRVLITVPFVMGWWVLAGRDRLSAVVGGVVLGLWWATYGHFLAPGGLPDNPLRLFADQTPPATVRWLDYTELWLISLPIYIVVSALVLLAAAVFVTRGGGLRRPLAATAALGSILLITGATVSPDEYGQTVQVSASGSAEVETGDFYSGEFTAGTAEIDVVATDIGGRVTPLPPHDRLEIDASVQTDGGAFEVAVRQPMVNDPLGRFTTWWGVGIDVDHHGHTGIGTDEIPETHSELAVFGVGDVTADGETIATGVPVHVMTADDGSLELDVGDPDAGPITGLPDGHLRVRWASYDGEVSSAPRNARYLGGGLFLLALLAGVAWLVRREPDDVAVEG